MKLITDMTEAEFLVVILDVFHACEGPDEKLLDNALDTLIRTSEYPEASDLVFWPAEEGLDTPEQILRIIKEWRALNGKPGFKRA